MRGGCRHRLGGRWPGVGCRPRALDDSGSPEPATITSVDGGRRRLFSELERGAGVDLLTAADEAGDEDPVLVAGLEAVLGLDLDLRDQYLGRLLRAERVVV